MQKTFAMIKPDAVKRNCVGGIIDMIEKAGFEIVKMKKVHYPRAFFESFYQVHSARPFFNDLVEQMSASPIVVMILQKENAINDWRNLMGATDPSKAEQGTIRAKFGLNVGENSVHGSDSEATARIECAMVFPSASSCSLK